MADARVTRAEVQKLQKRLREAEGTLRAIRQGEVDALVVGTPDGDKVYTLKGADEPYRLLVEKMSQGAVTIGHDGLIFFSNARFAAMMQSPLETVIGSSFFRFFTREDQPLMEALLREGAGSAEFTLHGEDGVAVPTFISLTPWQIEEMPGFCMIITDLSEQKRQEELLAAQQLARYTIDQANEPILVCDPNGRILRASQAAFTLCGENPILQPFPIVFPLDYGTAKESCRQETLAQGDGQFYSCFCENPSSNIEANFRRKDGTIRHLLLNSGPLLDDQGRVIGCVIMITDITERKQMEAELRKAKEELERRVHERTIELERSNADLQQFAYVASHDLQEPLRMVASYVGLLERNYRDRLDNDAREFIDFAVEGSKRMQALIKGLLEYSRINTRGNPLIAVDSQMILQTAQENLQFMIEETGAQITHDPMPHIVADPVQVAQVFQNLIGNAMKFHKPDELPRIHISARKQDGMWTFEIRDNGIGIDKEFFNRIFTIFQRLHTRRHYPGNGLGLAIVKRIIERHGGQIWVESTPGQGTTFYFTLPAAKSEAESPAS